MDIHQIALVTDEQSNEQATDTKHIKEIEKLMGEGVKGRCVHTKFLDELEPKVREMIGISEKYIQTIESVRTDFMVEAINAITLLVERVFKEKGIPPPKDKKESIPKLVKNAFKNLQTDKTNENRVDTENSLMISFQYNVTGKGSLKRYLERDVRKVMQDKDLITHLVNGLPDHPTQGTPELKEAVNTLVNKIDDLVRIECNAEKVIDISEVNKLREFDKLDRWFVALVAAVDHPNNKAMNQMLEQTDVNRDQARKRITGLHQEVKQAKLTISQFISQSSRKGGDRIAQANRILNMLNTEYAEKHVDVQGTIKVMGGLVFKEGVSPNGADTFILIIPGFMNHALQMKVLADSLAKKGCVCYIGNLPGQRGATGQFIMSHMSEMIIRLSDQLMNQYQPKQFVVLGHSTGAIATLFSLMGFSPKLDYEKFLQITLQMEAKIKAKTQTNPNYDALEERDELWKYWVDMHATNLINPLRPTRAILTGCPPSFGGVVEKMAKDMPVSKMINKLPTNTKVGKLVSSVKNKLPFKKNTRNESDFATTGLLSMDALWTLRVNSWGALIQFLKNAITKSSPFDFIANLDEIVTHGGASNYEKLKINEAINNCRATPKSFSKGGDDGFLKNWNEHDLIEMYKRTSANGSFISYPGMHHKLHDSSYDAAFYGDEENDIFSFMAEFAKTGRVRKTKRKWGKITTW